MTLMQEKSIICQSDRICIDQISRLIVKIAICLLLILVSLRVPIFRSLWLDETVTAWVVSSDWSETWRRATIYQAQSPLYFMLIKAWPWRGESEFLFRVPSVLCALGTVFGLSQLARQVWGRDAQLIAILSCVSQIEFIMAAIQARPYALGILAAVWSVVFLLSWVSKGNVLLLVAHFGMALLAFYSHYLFCLVGLVFLTILFIEKDRCRWLPYCIGLMCATFLALPGLYHLAWWGGKADGALFAAMPSTSKFLQRIIPGELLVYLLGGGFVGCLFTKQRLARPPLRVVILVGVWIVGGCAVLFLASHLSGQSVFVGRYLGWRVGGFVLGTILVASLFSDFVGQRAFFAVYSFLAIQQASQRVWEIEDWSGTAKTLAEQPHLPVMLYSGLRESEQLTTESGDDFRSYLASPLLAYEVSASSIVVMPGNPESEGSRRFSEGATRHIIGSETAFYLVINDQPIYVSGERVEPGKRLIGFFDKLGVACTVMAQRPSRGLVTIHRCETLHSH
jgi:hypothetical protein